MSQLLVFVSHSSQDNAFCDGLVKALRGAGADVWYDQHDLGTGELMEDITRELSARQVFIIILSEGAFGSKWVRKEAQWYWSLYFEEPQRTILPVTAQPIEASDFHGEWLFLTEFTRVEAPSFQPYPHPEAIERTLALLSLTPKGKAAKNTPPQPTESTKELIARGKGLVAQERYAEALPFFEQATQQSKRSHNAWFQLGYALGNLRRYEEALTAFDRAIHYKPDDAPSWYNKGFALNCLTRYEEALDAFEHTLALAPNYVLAWSEKGVALNCLSRNEEALLAQERAVALDPQSPVAWYRKARVLGDLGRSVEALDAVTRALELQPDDANSWGSRGVYLNQLGRVRGAGVL